MPKNNVSVYEWLVYAVYGYFMLLALVWLCLSLWFGHTLNYWALLVLCVFGTQAYYRHRLTNLILGILGLAVSVFWVLEFVSLGHQVGYNMFVGGMLAVFVLSLVSSGILIFSYTKLSFSDR